MYVLVAQVDEDQHIELLPEWLQHINHSCDPNVLFDTRARKLVALRDIQPGDELCCFYPATEWVMDNPFVCRHVRFCVGHNSVARYQPGLKFKVALINVRYVVVEWSCVVRWDVCQGQVVHY